MITFSVLLDTDKPQTCGEEEEVEGEGRTATTAALEAGAGTVLAGNKERESSVTRSPKMAGAGWMVEAAGVDATRDAEAEEEEGPKQLESGSAAGI